jgi:spermidine synthase
MPRHRLLYLAFACSGAAALMYETTWTRLLTLFMGHTVAAASSVLAAFMGGLAIGAAVAGRIAPGLSRSKALQGYAALEILIGLLAFALPFEIAGLRPLLAATYADGDGGVAFGALRLASALLVVTLPAMAMGATLPLVVRWAVDSAAQASRETARLYASNTLGATIGAVASGFVLLPAIGMRGTTGVAVVLNLVSAASPRRPGLDAVTQTRKGRACRQGGERATSPDARRGMAALAATAPDLRRRPLILQIADEPRARGR